MFNRINKIVKLRNSTQQIKIYRGIRVLEVTEESLIGVKGYTFYKYDFKIKKWTFFAKAVEPWYSLLSNYKLTRRLLRIEVTNLYTLKNNVKLCIAKKGIYKLDDKKKQFIKCYHVKRGSRPLNLCEDKNGIIYFGEYFSNIEKNKVHVYKSVDSGNTWKIAFTFKEGTINHIHGIFYDKYTERLWIVTGDRENECIIGYSDNEFKTVNYIFRGGQEYRTCNLLFYQQYIIFATDSQYIKNNIKMIDRKTNVISEIQSIQGSCIYAVPCGDYALLATTVEPSVVNLDCNSYLWFSENGIDWEELLHFKKDILPDFLFQLGSIRFPQYILQNNNPSKIYLTGRALKIADGNTIEVNIKDIRK